MKRGTLKWARSLNKKWMNGLSKWEVQHLAESQDGIPTLARLKANAEGGLCRDCILLARKFKLIPQEGE